MESKLLKGAASPANWARKIAGPFTVFMRGQLRTDLFNLGQQFRFGRRSTPTRIDGEILGGTFCRSVEREEKRHVGDVVGENLNGEALPFHHFLFELGCVPELDLALGPDGAGRDRVDPDLVWAVFAGLR